MSYRTNFTLQAAEIDKHTFDVIDEALITINADMEPTEPDPADTDFNWHGSDLSWYDHEEDMVKLSQQFPDILFILSGNGENAEDLWKKYFFGGLVQRAPAQITYEELNKNKLRRLDEKEDTNSEVHT